MVISREYDDGLVCSQQQRPCSSWIGLGSQVAASAFNLQLLHPIAVGLQFQWNVQAINEQIENMPDEYFHLDENVGYPCPCALSYASGISCICFPVLGSEGKCSFYPVHKVCLSAMPAQPILTSKECLSLAKLMAQVC